MNNTVTRQVLGKIMITSKGEYNSLKSYEILDAVTYQGSSYLSKKYNNDSLPTNANDWQLLAQKGDTYELSEEDLQRIAEQITSNANSAFNQNVKEKTDNFNSNANSKTEAYDTNADTKINEYDENHNSKIAIYNSNSSKLDGIINGKAVKLYGAKILPVDGIYIRKEDNVLTLTLESWANEHKSLIIPLKHYKNYLIKKSKISDRFVIGLIYFPALTVEDSVGTSELNIITQLCKVVFNDASATEAWFNSGKYNYAVVYVANKADEEWASDRIFTLYSEDNEECDDYVYAINDLDKISNSVDNMVDELTYENGSNINNISLYEIGDINNGTLALQGHCLRTKDYLDENINEITRENNDNLGFYCKIVKFNKDSKYIGEQSFSNNIFNYKLDHNKYKYKFVVSAPQLTDRGLIAMDGIAFKTIKFVKDSFYSKNIKAEKLNVVDLWEFGDISYNDGSLEESQNKIRTKNFLDSSIDKIVLKEHSIQFGIRIYDFDEKFIKAENITNYDEYSLYPDYFKYKILMVNNDFANIFNIKFEAKKIPSNIVINDLPIIPYWKNWNDVRYNYGFDKQKQPIFNTIKGVLETDTMLSVRGGKGRWNKNDKPSSEFVAGGHLFEGWSANELCRLTMLIGKFHETFACIQTYSPAGLYEKNRRFGWVKLGSDEKYKGVDFSQGWTKLYTPLTLPDLANAPTFIPDCDLNPQLSAYTNSVPIGTMYYDTTIKKVRVYTDTGWQNLKFE